MFLSRPRAYHPGILILILYLCLCEALIKTDYREFQHPFTRNSDDLKQDENSRGLFDNFAYTASTDESKLKLALLVDDKIDKNKDGLVQLDELVNWLRECQAKYAREDANRHWRSFGKSLDEASSTLSWDEFVKHEYDHVHSMSKQSDNPEHINQMKKTHDKHIQRDLRRWETADVDRNGQLSKNEFESFLYPEHFQHMHKLVVEEKYDQIDRDNDGLVSMDEYLSDLPYEGKNYDQKGREEWLRNEKYKFSNQLDVNHDNLLDRSELSAWIGHSELNDHSIAEAKHLMQSTDSNRDHRLSKEEILAAFHEFVNSHATDFGEALTSHIETRHDEL